MNRLSISKTISLCLIAIVILTSIIYWRGLSGPLLLDDHPQLGPILDSASHSFSRLMDLYVFSNSGPLKRPVAMASFILNAYVFGTDIWWWKLGNLIVHLLCGMVIYFLLLRVLTRLHTATCSSRQWLALLITSLWLLHPLQVSTVLYTVQRMTQFACLFSVLGMLTYMIGRDRIVKKQKFGWPYIAAAYFICLPLAAFSKETGLLLVLYLGLIELMLYKGDHLNSRPQIGWLWLSPAAITIFFGAIVLLVNFNNMVLAGYEHRDFTLVQRVMTEWRVLTTYLLQIVFPFHSSLGFYYDDLQVSMGLFQPLTTIISLLILVVLALVAWFAKRRFSLVSFGIAFFFIGHILESTIFPLELMYEHRNYMPMLGIIMALCGFLNHVLQHMGTKRMLAFVSIIILGLLNFFRVDTWSSAEKLFPALYQYHPGSERLTAIMANNAAENGDYKTAYLLLERINNFATKTNTLYLQCRQGKAINDEALRELKQEISSVINAYALTGLIELANLGLDEQCKVPGKEFADFLTHVLDKKFKTRSDKYKLQLYKAYYLRKQGEYTAALADLDKLYSTDPANPIPLLLFAQWSSEVGQLQQARWHFDRALTVIEASPLDYSEVVRQTQELLNIQQDKHN